VLVFRPRQRQAGLVGRATLAPPPVRVGSSQQGWRALLLRRSRHLHWIDAAVAIGLFGLAVALRLPRLHDVPPYTDELAEVLRGWAVAEGKIRPLVNVDAYIGSLWTYLVAGAFWLGSRSADHGRTLAMLFGAGTVVMTYLLGRAVTSRTVAVVAGLVMAANATHILLNSHVAWSNSITPFFTTAGFALLAWAVRLHSTPRLWWALAGAGLAFGLAFQTHPSTLAFLPAAAIWGLRRDARVRSLRSIAIAGVCFCIGYANVIAHNLKGGFATVAEAARMSDEYRGEAVLDGFGYAASVANFLLLTGQAVGGGVEELGSPWPYLGDPLVIVASLAAVAGLVLTIRQRSYLPLIVFLSALAILPVLNQRWAPIRESRYLMPMIPVMSLAIATALVGIASTVGRRFSLTSPLARMGLLVAAAALFCGTQIFKLYSFYEVEIAAGRSSADMRRWVELVDQSRRLREPFVVHEDLHWLKMAGGGNWATSLDFLLEMKGVRGDVASPPPPPSLDVCEVTHVELRYVDHDRDGDARRGSDDPKYPTYWIARQSQTDDRPEPRLGTVRLEAPYTAPSRRKSLFDPRVATGYAACD
jgi:4-amino-4-deoxy-L-arabinose transferase-like glycosyltransferase